MFKKLTIFVDSALRREFEESERIASDWLAFDAALQFPSLLCKHLRKPTPQIAFAGFSEEADHITGKDFQAGNDRGLKLYDAFLEAVRIEATVAKHYEFDLLLTMSFFPKGEKAIPLHQFKVGFYVGGRGHSPDIQ